MKTYVLDACALVALINGEEGAEAVDDLFRQAVKGEAKLFMSIINLLEVYYGFAGDIGIPKTQEMLKVIDETPLAVISAISEQAYHEAARIKGTLKKLSLADAAGLATTVELDGVFVTSDHHELDAIAAKDESLKFFWFR